MGLLERSLVIIVYCTHWALAQAPTLPSEDPFYDSPANIGDYWPGQTIRSRQVSPLLSGSVPKLVNETISNFTQYLYRTTDSLGKPVAAVTSILVPENADPTKLLAYQTAYDSTNNDCSPSFLLQAASGGALTNDIVFIAAALNNGWYVVTSDYEGLDAQYVAGMQAGYATLDSVRVALQEGPSLGLSPAAKYALWGYSGGSVASEWATELQCYYAPELEFQGAALGGLVPNISHAILTINNGLFAGLAFAGIEGLSKAYSNFGSLVSSQLIPTKSAKFASIADGCSPSNIVKGEHQNLFSYFQQGQAFLYDPAAQAVLNVATQMGNHGIPQMPLFVYKAIEDEISPVEDTDELVQKYCESGATIQYQRSLVGGHISDAIEGGSTAISWIADRLAGIPVSNYGECVVTSVDPTNSSAQAAEGLDEISRAFLLTVDGGTL